MEGWIKIHRSLLDWEWYADTNCVRLALHLLLKANYQPKKWQGVTIERGQLATSRGQLSEETSLTAMQVRTTLDKLQRSGFITKSATSKYTLVTVCNYASYQQLQDGYEEGCQPANNQRITNEQPADNQRITTTKESKKERIEEYTHTVVSEKGVVGGNESELLAWIGTNYPAVQAMPQPLTEQNIVWMLRKYTVEDIQRIIQAMHNKRAFENVSAYATFTNFAKYDKELADRQSAKSSGPKPYTWDEVLAYVDKNSGAVTSDFDRQIIKGRPVWFRKSDLQTHQ